MTHAKTIFEPSVSLGSGSGDVSGTIANTAVSGSTSALVGNFGFRYGITRRYIHVTAMLEGAMLAGGDTTEAVFTGMLGLGIGYEWNIPLRTYLFAGAYDFDTDFVGGGIEVAYMVSESMWLGIRAASFKTEAKQGIETTPGTTQTVNNAQFDLTTISLVVTFPFEFNYPDHWFRKTDWE